VLKVPLNSSQSIFVMSFCVRVITIVFYPSKPFIVDFAACCSSFLFIRFWSTVCCICDRGDTLLSWTLY